MKLQDGCSRCDAMRAMNGTQLRFTLMLLMQYPYQPGLGPPGCKCVCKRCLSASSSRTSILQALIHAHHVQH